LANAFWTIGVIYRLIAIDHRESFTKIFFRDAAISARFPALEPRARLPICKWLQVFPARVHGGTRRSPMQLEKAVVHQHLNCQLEVFLSGVSAGVLLREASDRGI